MRKTLAAPPPAPVDRASRDVFLWTLLAGSGLLLALAGPFLLGKIYVADDLGAYHLPLRAFYAEQLAGDQSFDWMPSLFCGFYLTGEGQAGTYHPLHWLLYSVFSLPTALGLEYLLSYPFLWAGTWLFLKRRLQHHAAALFGGLIFTFAGFNLLHFVHPNAVAIVAHLPWLLWCIDVVLTDTRRRRILAATLGIALLTGSQLLIGYPQYVWFSLLTEAAYAGFLLYSLRYTPRYGCAQCPDCRACIGCHARTWPYVLLGKGFGLMLGGIQLLPTLDALQHGARASADAAFTASGSLHPLNLLQLVAPYLFAQRVVGQNTHELGLYLGAVPLLLVVWLWIRRHELGALKPLALAAAGFSAVALILAFGRYGGLYFLQAYLPGIGSFRFPCRYLVLFQAGMALQAALGFLLLLRHYQAARQPRTLSTLMQSLHTPLQSFWKRFEDLWIILGLCAALALIGLLLCHKPYIASPLAVLSGAGLFFFAAWLITQVAAGKRGALVRLILLTAVDLGIYGLSNSVYPHATELAAYIARVPTPPAGKEDSPHLSEWPDQPSVGARCFTQRGTVPFSRTNPPGRVVSCLLRFDEPGLRIGDQITLCGFERADGYVGLEPRRRLDYRHLAALRVAGVRWVQKRPTTEDIAGIRWHDEQKRGTVPTGKWGLSHFSIQWGEVPDPLPRVRLVNRTVSSEDLPAVLDQIELDETAVTEVPLALPPGARGTAELCEDQPGRIVVQTESAQPRLLVLAESYHPGWKARVLDQSRPVFRVNGDFLGCLVGPGKERIIWEFQPDSLRRGRSLSLLGLGLLPLVALGLMRWPSNRFPLSPKKGISIKDVSSPEDEEDQELTTADSAPGDQNSETSQVVLTFNK